MGLCDLQWVAYGKPPPKNSRIFCCQGREKPCVANPLQRNKCLERFSFSVGDNLQAAASKTFEGEQFHCDRQHYLASGTAPAFAVPHTSKDGLIYFNVFGQHVVSSIADGAPEPVQHRPSRRVPADANDNHLLATLMASDADWLITGDSDFDELSGQHSLITPDEFVRRFL